MKVAQFFLPLLRLLTGKPLLGTQLKVSPIPVENRQPAWCRSSNKR
ncbi:hypothetical protein [Pedobacter sp. L105]|nr:hypothetical protein [Pedobacter sp. L105]